MIDHLNEQRNLNGFGVGHIYFEYQEQKQQTVLAVVASLVKQLLSQIPPAEFPKDIEAKYQAEKHQHATADGLIDMLLSMPTRFAEYSWSVTPWMRWIKNNDENSFRSSTV